MMRRYLYARHKSYTHPIGTCAIIVAICVPVGIVIGFGVLVVPSVFR